MNHERLMMIQSASRAEPQRKRSSRDEEFQEDQVKRRRDNRHRRNGHHDHHRHRRLHHKEENEEARSRGFPSLKIELLPLSFPTFDGCEVQEAPDFDTSCDEQPDDATPRLQQSHEPSTMVDRLRGEDGGIDLGLNRTDLGRIGTESDYHDKKTRKMINYDPYGQQRKESTTTASQVNSGTTKTNRDDVAHVDRIPFTFGDRGSTWRMMRLGKLDSGHTKRPSKAQIFEQYATIWDYDLACMERDELESRKRKRESEWVYTPPESFMKKRKYHVMANKRAMRDVIRVKEEEEKLKQDGSKEAGEDGGQVVFMKKHGDVKMSKSQKIRNELKLAHLTSLDHAESENYLSTISREEIESLTNSP